MFGYMDAIRRHWHMVELGLSPHTAPARMLDKAKGNGKIIVHKGLEGCCRSAQAKTHDQRLMFAFSGVKGSLLKRSCQNLDPRSCLVNHEALDTAA